MKDEIKEILDLDIDRDDKLVSIKYIDNLGNIHEYESINADHLFNYITNLQKKVEQYENPDDLTLITMYCDLKAKDKIKQLQEENDYLKDIVSNTELSDEIKKADKWSKRELYKINYQRLQVNKRLREENRQTKLLKDRYQLQKENYKSRNEKAIKMFDNETLNKYYYGMSYEFEIDDFKEDMLNILKGSDKE